MPFLLPVTDPVLIFALAMIIFVVAPLLFERLRVPGLIGLIVAGALVGPHGLNVLERGPTIVLLGTVGLLYLMFMIGLELNLHEFNRYRNRSLIFGSLSFLIPQVAGTAMGLAFGYSTGSSLLLGAVFASHTVLAYPIASRLGIVKNAAVTTTLGGTILTEILALLVLAVVTGAVGGAIGWGFWLRLGVSLTVYVAAVLWGAPILARWFFRNVRSEASVEFLVVMAILFSVSYLAHFAGVEPIIGALLAGLALNRLVPETGTMMNRIHFVGNAFFIPFFLVSVGMLVNVQALVTVEAWTIAVALAGGVTAAKWLAAKVTEKVFGYNADEGWVVFGLSVPHASGTLAIVLVGFDIGLLDQTEVNGVVLTILVTSLVGPWVVERYGRRVAVQEEQKPYEPREAPQRIVIPVSNPGTEESLLDLAFLIRAPGSEEPIYPLMVVRDVAEGTEAQVAEAEKMLSHAVIYAAGAEVPVAPLTRVDQNIAVGIARGMAETRSTIAIVGWDGRPSIGGVFGSVLDQLLEQTRQMVIVAKHGHPLNTTSRLVLVLPPLIHRHPGFYDAARTSKVLAARLGIPVVVLVVEASPERYRELYDPVKPVVAASYERVGGWGQLLAELRRRLTPDDLVMVLGARRGTLPWHPRLDRLPGQLATLAPESFLMIFPSEADTSRREAPSAADVLPRGLMPERIVFNLPSMPFDAALRHILQAGFHSDEQRIEAIVEALVRGEEEYSTEVRPGVVVPHARVAGLEEPILCLGTSPEGITFPHTRGPAHLIFVLLSPAERPLEHLRSLAEIARLVSSEEHVEDLLGGRHQGLLGGEEGTEPVSERGTP